MPQTKLIRLYTTATFRTTIPSRLSFSVTGPLSGLLLICGWDMTIKHGKLPPCHRRTNIPDTAHSRWDSILERTSNDSISKAIRCYENYNISNTPLSRGILNGSKYLRWSSSIAFLANTTVKPSQNASLGEAVGTTAINLPTSPLKAFTIHPQTLWDLEPISRHGLATVQLSCQTEHFLLGSHQTVFPETATYPRLRSAIGTLSSP